MKKRLKKIFISIIILTTLYVLLGNVPAIQKNPIIPEAVVAVNMIIIVLSGILFGKRTGAIVGFLGTLINALITGSSFEYFAILPHTIMGYFAGFFKERTNNILASLSIIIGHALNIVSYLVIGILSISNFQNSDFWLGIIYETIFGIISIIILAYLYEGIFCKK